jgi:hypothetical protein
MASRLALGRIIEWSRNCDMEELHYVIHRIGNIAQTRARLVENADAHGKVKRATRKHRDRQDDVKPPAAAAAAAAAQDNVNEKSVSA